LADLTTYTTFEEIKPTMIRQLLLGPTLIVLSLVGCAQDKKSKKAPTDKSTNISTRSNMDTITFGSGCFWCTEAIFQQVKGVEQVISGYSGGHVVNPTYEQICEKNTGHAEVCQLVYDPSVVSIPELLEVFWQTHDPTTLNRQGNDVGPQYRSVIFYHSEAQRELAEAYKKDLDASGAFPRPIVTTVEPFKNFYRAEEYHQNYYRNNPSQAYCYFVIRPKLEKFEKVFKDRKKKAE
jgi:peptide-methionine (S)-S-oxide reductase